MQEVNYIFNIFLMPIFYELMKAARCSYYIRERSNIKQICMPDEVKGFADVEVLASIAGAATSVT
ncbi:MAG: hypothetical protein RBT15_08830 [Gudongella sp.]|jgi:hypothetical protein|nr:hypothetical protein [Gudongella sp.]